MKSPLLPALTTCLVLFALITTKPWVVEADNSQVLDTDGNPVRWNRYYYILPIVIRHIPWNGGLSLGWIAPNRCQLFVIQLRSGDGLPVKLAPLTSRLPVVTTSSDLYFKFGTNDHQECRLPLVWNLLRSASRLWFLRANGPTIPNPNTLQGVNSVFRIEPYGLNSYKIVFCPENFDVPTMCKGIGMYFSGNQLSLRDDTEPVRFVFKRVNVNSSDSSEPAFDVLNSSDNIINFRL
ncbi:Kunitz trypsin inhibitor [Quillaja saponaria]|uniref:Kunitz trypsin inhibitor n=1 Tax=Quillaja saponaria TaxID=32244 RepID=A0AAD7M5R5_QUISA|nr:Kunitz trypsin inhibitor [Quillaja saponaria]